MSRNACSTPLDGTRPGGDVQDEAQDRPDTVWLGRGGRLLQATRLPGGAAPDARGDPGLERGRGGRDRPAPRDLLRRSPPPVGPPQERSIATHGLVAPRSQPTPRRALQRRRGPVRWASRPRPRAPPWPARSLVHPPVDEDWHGLRRKGSVRAGVTAWVGRPSRAPMTLPPPAPRGPTTGNKGTRPRAPVSDRPAEVLLAETSLPRHAEGARLYAGIDWAADTHAICVLDDAGHTLSTFTIA